MTTVAERKFTMDRAQLDYRQLGQITLCDDHDSEGGTPYSTFLLDSAILFLFIFPITIVLEQLLSFIDSGYFSPVTSALILTLTDPPASRSSVPPVPYF